MSCPAKSSRPAQGRTGQARTRLPRWAVADTVRDLFLERGYAATTVEAISEHSDVPPATIYRLFSAKLGILKALLDVSIAGDDQELTVQGRPEITALFAEPDPGKLVAGFAGINVAINTTSTEVYRILVSASGSDPRAHSPELYRLLVTDRGWPPQRYQNGSHQRSPSACSLRGEHAAPQGSRKASCVAARLRATDPVFFP